ncbi:1-aminocyclopropane-1-carboxylate synthase-like protein 1 isoform X2 [Pecten maximus]|uniref:1-aminocyclopropane-1-carboxylate synthase-like protein 1 isoform X2 n=1 Tax=Pecten maximus TaxID=6579 RepID=UPI0014580978|nr:1-aminocyclopropane-1-carboxylate synthase-like protein 1 isoform X2 [Pecten maximus]
MEKEIKKDLISKRSQVNSNIDFLTTNFIKAAGNIYDPLTNPQGYINFGVSENKIAEIAGSSDFSSVDILYYFALHGTQQLRRTLSKLIGEHFKSKERIDEEKIVCMGGVSAILNALAFTLADPGDVFLCPTPVYTRIKNDMLELGGVDIYEVPMFDITSPEDPFKMRIDLLESYLQKARNDGLNVRGVVLVNPNNPTGKVYNPHELQQLMTFCKREELHVIADEIYALTTQCQGGFTSVLSLSIPDPQRTHFVWGLSKDFGLSGFRCGVVYSHDIRIIARLKQIATFQPIPAPTQKLINGILSDTEWIDKVYFPAYYERAKAMYKLVKEVLDELNIPTPYSCRNAMFFWMDLSQFLKDLSREEENKLFNRFMEAGLYIIPGMEMLSQIPGWFRLTFTLPEHEIQEGLRRFRAVLTQKGNKATTS